MLHTRPDRSYAMPRTFFPLRRTEIEPKLQEGDRRFGELVEPHSVLLAAGRTLVPAGQEQRFVYRLRSGWCARLRYLRDGRSQVSAILLPGDLLAVRSMLLEAQPDEIAAITDCEFDVVDQAVLREAAVNDAALMLRLWWQTQEDERRLQNWLIALSRGRARNGSPCCWSTFVPAWCWRARSAPRSMKSPGR